MGQTCHCPAAGRVRGPGVVLATGLEGECRTRTTMVNLIDAVPAAAATRGTRRQITPRAGRALEILAHALEYLSDECAVSAAAAPPLEDRLEAIELLKSLNRRVYLECAEIPRAGVRSFLRRCFG